jgi:hypothetical protein
VADQDPKSTSTGPLSRPVDASERAGLSQDVWRAAADLVAAITRCYDLSESARMKLRTALWTWLGWIIDVLQRPAPDQAARTDERD